MKAQVNALCGKDGSDVQFLKNEPYYTPEIYPRFSQKYVKDLTSKENLKAFYLWKSAPVFEFSDDALECYDCEYRTGAQDASGKNFYLGQWKDGKKNGRGTEIVNFGVSIVSGYYKDDELVETGQRQILTAIKGKKSEGTAVARLERWDSDNKQVKREDYDCSREKETCEVSQEQPD